MSQIKRAVTFYSFQDNYVRKKMSLDDIMSYVKNELQADMEFIPDQMLKGAPYSTEETLKEWDRLVAKNGIRPVCCGSYINDKLYKNRMLTIKEGTQKLIDEIKLERKMPLLIEIPDRHGTGRKKDFITSYVNEAIGLKL